MNISNNRSFYNDSITEGWTKKDWALNLLPLGGVACVAYEIGSACVSTRDQTAKISQNFFKSPIQTTLKKMAQCLWVPIVICGALKLVCLIVTACWERCFPPTHNRPAIPTRLQDPEIEIAGSNSAVNLLPEPSKSVPKPDSRSLSEAPNELSAVLPGAPAGRPRKENQVLDPLVKDPCGIIPHAVVVAHIFSYLNLHELGVSRSVSKRWNAFANTPILWRAAIYRELAFSSKNWAQWDADIVKDVDVRQEMLSLPTNIAEELRRAAFPGKSLRETHVLVRMPKGLTLNKLGELAKKYFPNTVYGYSYIWSEIVDELGDKPANESVWLLMTTKEIDNSRSKSYIEQQAIVADLAIRAQVPYAVPTTLEAATCILAEYSRSGKRLFNNEPLTYTRCQEKVQGYQVLVGGFGFARAGLDVDCNSGNDVDIGVAALWKF